MVSRTDPDPKDAFRVERDAMGEVRVPDGALWGAQTQRALENFPISGQRFPRRFLRALGTIKRACAETNAELGLLDARLADAIATAAQEVADGALDHHFPLDVFQTGSGTSTNMNANEVIANRAIQALGGVVGSRAPVHPNDHVNLGQSSNDVVPTAMHVAGAAAISEDLIPALEELRHALAEKARAFDGIVKSGRTHLMDATPVRLGQELGGWAAQVDQAVARAAGARAALLPLALGGTAVGTGLNRPATFPGLAVGRIAAAAGLPFREAEDHFAAQGAQDAVVEASGQLRAVAVALIKVANDIRLLGSGPRAGLRELRLPAVQPGSSIMPGKVNPVMCEMLVMVGYQVMGNDAAVAMGGQGGHLELNACLPLMADNLLRSVGLLANGARTFARRCVAGLEADEEGCAAGLERNLSLATALVPAIGYDRAAALAYAAHRGGTTVREVARAERVLPEDELQVLLDPRRMTEPGGSGSGG